MILQVMRLCFPLRNWLDEQVSQESDLERLALSNMDWKKLKYLIILLRPFAEYTSLIGNTRDITIRLATVRSGLRKSWTGLYGSV